MRSGILGINARNLVFIRPSNSRRAIRLADDKLATKRLLQKTGILTPRLYGVIKDIRDFETFNWNKLPVNFVVKPNLGFGGEGIVILRSKYKKKDFIKLPIEKRIWLTSKGEEWDFERLKSHILDILDGNFSLSGVPDTALIERKILLYPQFRNYVRKGIPDIRIIVYNKVPVMAMMRLPTEASKGKANLAQGAVGLGIDVGTGITTTAMVKIPRRKVITKHPDTNQELSGLQIPFWDKILETSIESQIASGIGFLGVDIAIDRIYGPEVLELNARPGLDIQIANLEGLAERLRRVDGLKIKNISHGVRVAKELFSGDIEKRVEEISGKEVIGVVEKVKILNKKGTRKIEVQARIDTGAGFTSIDRDLAIRLGFKDAIKYYDSFNIKGLLTREEADQLTRKKVWKKLVKHEDIISTAKIHSSHGTTYRIMVPLVYFLSGKKITSKASIIQREELTYPMIIGREDLKDFLVDPTKRSRVISKKIKKK